MIAQFALRLLLGMSLTWAVLPRRAITSGFFRIQLLVALGLSVLAAVTVDDLGVSQLSETAGSPQASAESTVVTRPVAVGVCVTLAVSSFLGSVAWTLERRKGGTAFLFAILLLAGGLLVATAAPREDAIAMRVFRTASEFSSSAILGSCVTAMLLGHWYLTATAMSIEPLKRANLWFGATVASRLVLSAVGLWWMSQSVSSSTHSVWLLLRWGAGIVLPLAMCVMVARILRYRNTQSATGVLFAATILVFLGELAGMLLARELGAPL